MAKSNASHTEFNENDVEVISVETPFQGYFYVDRLSLRHKREDGSWCEPMTREIFERGHAVGMLPYDPNTDEIILIEQFRPGALRAGYNPWLLEIPAGIIDAGEKPDDVAVRETHEETGCAVQDHEFIMDYLVTPGGSTESFQLYCVKVDASSASEYAGLAEEGEYIKVLKLPSSDVINLLKSGNIHNSMTIIAVQWFIMNQTFLRDKWCS